MNLRNIQALAGEDIGQTFYVVDSDYRTGAQGWSRTDRTGPIDLYSQREADRVHYTPGGVSSLFSMYTTDAGAIQGAINQCVDFRGDKVLLTPGSYTPATALTLDSAGMRFMGPRSNHPGAARVTLTAGVDAALTVSDDDIEIANFKCVPLTAANLIDVSSGADRGHIHHVFYDAAGITGSTSTEFLASAASVGWLVEHCRFNVDAAQGDAFTLTSSQRWIVQDCDFFVGLTGIAWASVFTFATSALGNIVRRCYFRGCGGATPAVFTTLFTGVANVNGQLLFADSVIDGTALATPGALESTFGTTLDIEIANIHYTGDASGEGGVIAALA